MADESYTDNYEYRICDYCNEPMTEGFMADGGVWYCCESCFDAAMRHDYPLGYRGTDEEGDCGGFWEYLEADGEWYDTGIFYTQWW